MNTRMIPLLCLTLLSVARSNAQFATGEKGLVIKAGTPVNIHNFTLLPDTDLSISNNNLLLEHTAIPGLPNASILRVYEWAEVIETDGTIGLFFENTELNGNALFGMQVAYSDTTGSTGFVVSTSSVLTGTDYVHLVLPEATRIQQITAAEYGIELPVEWLFFTAVSDGNLAILEWEVASERAVNKYLVQRSHDGISYIDIEEVAPKCNYCNSPVKYVYIDREPLIGNNFYRIAEKSIDGKISYTSIRKLNFTAENSIHITPNPADAFVRITGLNGKNVALIITDINGKRILERVITDADSYQIEIADFVRGTYYLSLIDIHGVKSTFKFIKV